MGSTLIGVGLPNRQRAPELFVSEWFNTNTPIALIDLRGHVVVLHAFQMLCPGCVLHGTPLAQRIHERFAIEGVTVIGLHTVFEHHDAMGPVSLAAFLHEFRVTMPVGVDAHEHGNPIPVTMAAYGMQGTPTLVIIDRDGYIRHRYFGQVDELTVGLRIGQLLAQDPEPATASNDKSRA